MRSNDVKGKALVEVTCRVNGLHVTVSFFTAIGAERASAIRVFRLLLVIRRSNLASELDVVILCG